jgi:hypothetical protein
VLEPLFPIVTAGRWGLIDRTGRIVVSPRYDALFHPIGFPLPKAVEDALTLLDSHPIWDELIPARLGNKWGFVGRSGELLVPPAFEDVSWFGEERLAPAELKGKYGFIDREGRFAINPQFEFA